MHKAPSLPCIQIIYMHSDRGTPAPTLAIHSHLPGSSLTTATTECAHSPAPLLHPTYPSPCITGHSISTMASTLSSFPLFSPSSRSSGLDLLAAAASAANQHNITPKPAAPRPSHSLHTAGTYNPAASLPPKVVKKILDLEFVEMSDISIIDDELSQTPSRPPAPARPPITEISQWIERFSLMAAVLCTRFPNKALELWAYQATIVRVERNYDGKRWVTCDRQFRREALARKDLNWSIIDPRLYNEAFTGHARSINRLHSASRMITPQHIVPTT